MAVQDDFECLLFKLSSCQLSHSDPIAERNKHELISQLRDLNDSNPDSGLCAVHCLFDPDGFHGFHEKVLNEYSKKAKETFRKIMQLKHVKKERDKRMPSKGQLEALNASDSALCKTLRDGNLRDFYKILYPKPEEDLQGTVFCLDDTKEDKTIFEDLTKRAKLLAKEIKEHKIPNQKIKCYLMDGHGRMLLCLIKALIEKDVDPDDDVEFTICELDDVVHEYHQYVFPSSVKKIKQNVLQGYGKYIENNSVVYLNFCSVSSSQINTTWKMNPRCVKENVLRFVSELTQPGRNCSVMVSLVIRDTIAEGEEKLFPIGGNDKKYVTGLGFLKVIRDKKLFNSKDGDILLRPDSSIPWDDPNTKRKPSAKGINGSYVQVFASVIVHHKGEEQTEDLTEWFDYHNIAYDFIRYFDMVEIISKADKGYHGLVEGQTSHTVKVVYYDGNDKLSKTKRLTSCRKLPENGNTDIMRQLIRHIIGLT